MIMINAITESTLTKYLEIQYNLIHFMIQLKLSANPWNYHLTLYHTQWIYV